MLVLGIESSCDDSGLALYDSVIGLIDYITVGQSIHTEFSGVVPELASRDHAKAFPKALNLLLDKNKLTLKDCQLVAYTYAPGLIGSLLTGVSFAKSIAFAAQIPAVKVHHLEGHIWSPFIDELSVAPKEEQFLSLLVSGGHTMLILVNGFGYYKIIGESLDDAVGEAFDKVAKSLGLSYPGGPELAALATKYDGTAVYPLPTPLIKYNKPTDTNYLNFSFSGLKSHIKRLISNDLKESDYPKLAYSFESKIADIIQDKITKAINLTGVNKVVVTGGVSANKSLREKLLNINNAEIVFPDLRFCTDNGAMIAYAGLHRYNFTGPDDNNDIVALPQVRLDSLPVPD